MNDPRTFGGMGFGTSTGPAPWDPRPVSGPLGPMQRAALAGPYAPRPVSTPLTPMQQAALAGPQGTGNPRLASGELSRISPGGGWPSSPATQAPRTIDPRLATGELSRIQSGMSWPQPQGNWPPSGGIQGPWGSNRPPAPAPTGMGAGPGFLRSMIGPAGRALMSPVGAIATTAATMLPWGDMANGMRSAQQGVNDFLGIGQGAPAPMPTPEMAVNAAPPMAMAPSMAGQIPAPMNYPETAAMRYPAPQVPAPVMAQAAPDPMPAPAPAPMPAPMPTYTPPGGVWEGQNQGIQDDTRARAMAWLALQQGMR